MILPLILWTWCLAGLASGGILTVDALLGLWRCYESE